MSTAIQPPQRVPRTLGSLFRPGLSSEKQGWESITGMIRNGRKVVRDESIRWQENREFYRGNQDVYYAAGESQLRGPMSGVVRNRATNNYNRLRQFTDGRTALLTKERPAYEVIPEDRDHDSIDAARQAEKFIAAKWGHDGWDIKANITELCKNGDIDGLAWLSVLWDSESAGSSDELIAVGADGQPLDRASFEAMKDQDPSGGTLWKMVRSPRPLGDVSWRVVLPAAISLDPFAVKSMKDARWICESRIRPREEVEEKIGMSFKDAVKDSKAMMRERIVEVQYEDLAVDEGSGRAGRVSEADGIIVHYFFARPCRQFPKGLRLEFADKIPGKPIVMEEWEDELPYFPFVPRPDPGHMLRSKGIVDDLKPIQRDYNRTQSDLREWLKRVARTPVAIPHGSMASDSYFNEDGYFFYHPGMGEPHHAQVPSEPVAVITNDLGRMVAEMRDISGISASAQGLRAPGGPEAAVGINLEIQQTENNLSEVEWRLKEAIEWGVSRSLQLVERHYNGVRMVTSLGVDDSEELAAFQGAMLRGAHRMRITSPLMPKSRAARMQALAQFAPLLGEKIIPYLPGLMDGDPTEMHRDLEVRANREQSDIRELVGMVRNEKAILVYKNFEEDKQKFTEAFELVVQSGSPDPMGELARKGITPTNLTSSLVQAGFEIPLVEDFYDPFLHMKELDEYRMGDGYRRLHPMAKQLLRERADSYKQAMNRAASAMAAQMPVGQQQGSAPRQPGTPSPPKNTTQAPGAMG